MSLNTSALGASTLQMTIGGAGGSNGLLGTSRQNAGLDSHSALGFGGSSHSDTVNQLAGMLTGMMMMMSMMGGGGLTSLLGGGSGGGLGSTLGGGLGAGIGGALGGPLGASVGSSLGSGIGGSAASAAGSSLDQALGLNPTSYGDSSASGSDSSADTSDPLQQLMKLFSEVMQSLFGDSQDATQGASTAGKQPTEGEQSAYKQGVTDALSALMGNGLSQSSGSDGLSDSAGTSLGGSSLSGKGLQNLSGPVDYQQLGNAIGTGVGMKAGIQALNDIGTHSDSPTRSFIDKGDRAMAKEVGQFMDQYPEVFGKPQYQKGPGTEVKTDDKSWAKALSKPDHEGMTPASMDQFNKAKGMIKSAMAGDSGNGNLQARGAGGASLGIDAMLTGDTINNMALSKLSVA